MTIQVQIPTPLRSLTKGAQVVEAEGAQIAGLIDDLERRHPGLKAKLCDDSGKLRGYVRIFVNEEDIRFLDEKATKLREGDRVTIIPAIAGGGR